MPCCRSNDLAKNGIAVRIAGVAMLGVALLGGCESPPSYSSSLDPDSEFARGADEPPSAATLYRLARVLSAQGRWVESSASLAACIDRYPDFMPAYADLAALHVSHCQYAQAMEVLERGLARAQNDPVLENDLGMVLFLSGRYEEALPYFQSASQQSPYDERYRSNVALALGMIGRYQDSLTVYRQVLEPREAYYNVAVICQARGDLQQARALMGWAGNHFGHDVETTPDAPELADDGALRAETSNGAIPAELVDDAGPIIGRASSPQPTQPEFRDG